MNRITLITLITGFIPLYPLSNIQLGMAIHYGWVLLVFVFIKKDIRVPKEILFLLLIYFLPSIFRIYFQEIRNDLLIGLVRDLSCILSFLIFYQITDTIEDLKGAYEKLLFASIIFISLQFALPNSIILSFWNPRGTLGFYGMQLGSFFVFSYSYGTFLLLCIALRLKLSVVSFSLAIFTQSKAVYLVLFPLTFFRLNFVKVFFVIILLFFVFWEFIGNIINGLPYVEFLIQTWMSGQLDPSTSYRLVQLDMAIKSVIDNPFIGDPKHYINIENQYLYWLSDYGLIGGFVRITVICAIFILAIRHRSRKAIIFVVFTMGLAFPVLDAPKISILVWGLLGSMFRITWRKKTIVY